MPRALLSVYDKTGVVEFAQQLLRFGFDIVASGGTERALRDAGLPVIAVEQITGVSQMLDGRVKTLHPAIHAGILARNSERDLEELRTHNFAPINMVVCNLYPFQETVADPGVALQDAIEQIDIGGVTLLRAAAKNFLHVVVLCHAEDYRRIIDCYDAGEAVDIALRRELAVKAFAHTRDYDTAVHAFLTRDLPTAIVTEELPEHLSLASTRVEMLRYGENPHQQAAYYSRLSGTGPLGGIILGGKQLSYNNILDLDAAWRAVSSFDEPTVVIVKHLTPCGIASAGTIVEAFPAALDSDPVSAFGGVIATNRVVDESFFAALGALFVEAIAASGFTSDAQALFAEHRKNCRLLQVVGRVDGTQLEVRSVHNGLLVQHADMGDPDGTVYRVVTQRQPTDEERENLSYVWKAVQHVKSNAIVLGVRNMTVGIGGGQPNRVDAVRIAVEKAGPRSIGSVMASDAFFPFPDSVEAAAAAGVTAIIQPGGSIRDPQIIDVADKAGIAMIFAGVRHFRH
ncbi:MAG: bifunctional phosphoribosylaminoimidazolecarboxamide formyltransferase/IMP cyclohydrolase [Anaerolineae bacterium]|nr:bifunctional phosphoribosylaminoimidazolecarboxamide formyltransferase/IMP cyclohydrolase [Anaerolineae bacterium]NUQ02750.1 bifunctional phosphoribosylaminoimidazolecarboxamide formyltransferase/IMP cyclohydrolase [Anaerolineae bacterium]